VAAEIELFAAGAGAALVAAAGFDPESVNPALARSWANFSCAVIGARAECLAFASPLAGAVSVSALDGVVSAACAVRIWPGANPPAAKVSAAMIRAVVARAPGRVPAVRAGSLIL
jgi:hypothetical protein